MEIEFLSQEKVLTEDTLNAEGEVLSFGFCEQIEHLCQRRVDVQHMVNPTIDYILEDKIISLHIHNIFWYWITVLPSKVLHQKLVSQLFVPNIFSEIYLYSFLSSLESGKSHSRDYHSVLILFFYFLLNMNYIEEMLLNLITQCICFHIFYKFIYFGIYIMINELLAFYQKNNIK